MEITTRQRDGYSFFELTVKSGNAEITEDLSYYEGERVYKVGKSDIENLFTAAFEAQRFNGKSDIDTMKMLFDSFLSDGEREDFIDKIS